MEAVSIAIYVVDKVLRLLEDEADLFRGANIDIKSLKLELETLRELILNTNALEWRAEAWLAEATSAMQHVDLVLEMYILQQAQRRHWYGFHYNTVVQKAANLIKKLIPGHVASGIKGIRRGEIQGIIRRLQEIRKRFVLFPLREGSMRERTYESGKRKWYNFIKEDELVGVLSQKEVLVRTLVGEPSTRLVISLVGIGGVGKTTLASVVCKSEEVRRHFDCYAWIDVSESFNFENLLGHLTQMICKDGDSSSEQMAAMQEPELISQLKQHLSTKRYLIVFDDVWKVDFWEVLNHVFPDRNNGSRIIITTRNNATAAPCDILKCLQPLSDEMAWELFRKQAFKLEKGNCPHELLEVAPELVSRCHGLPRVIKAIAGVLSTKMKFLSELKMILSTFNDGYREDPQSSAMVSSVFSRSYDDLPFHTRLCFLYFGIFPKDFLVPDKKLFNLWIAEGFVKEEIGKTLEQTAEMYLNELINRNLVQVSHIKYDAAERLCRVHGYIHGILVAKAQEFQIFEVIQEEASLSFVEHESRRLSIYGGAINTLQITAENSNVRSVCLFDVHGTTMSTSLVVSLAERFKLLELLDFENTLLDDLPKEVGNLFFLKYLSLRNTKVKKLPKSVGLLLNLQTLDVRNTLIKTLPIEIKKLQKLRHLLAGSHSVSGVRIMKGIGYLENLQTLMTVEATSTGLAVIKELKNLRELRCLSISKMDRDILNTLCTSIKKMNCLESLNLYSSKNLQSSDLESISDMPPSLERLILKGQLEKLPEWILRLQNLSTLGLSFSRLTIDPLKALTCLPNLTSLLLHQAYDGQQLHFEEGSFRKLKKLALTELHELRMIKIEREALPILEDLTIGPSPVLNELPSGIEHLRNLRVLANLDMPTEFVHSMQPDGGLDYWKIQHVSSVLFWYRVPGGGYVTYKLGESDLLDHLQGLPTNKKSASQHDLQLSSGFSYGTKKSASTSTVQWNYANQLSFTSTDQFTIYTDDVVD